MIEQGYSSDDDISFKKLFVPLTTFKAIHIIVIIGFLVFINTLFNQFVWDDLIYIFYNTQIHNFNLEKIFGESFFNVGGQYRPIPALYYSILYSLFKDVTFFYHIFSIAIHILNSVFVYLLFNKFFKNYISLFFALVFLVHPMQVESVAFISTSANNLYFSFGLAALLLCLREEISLSRVIAISSLLAMSYLSKETGTLFLFVIIISRFFYHKTNFSKFFYIGILTFVIYSILRFGVGHIFFDKQELGFVPIYRLSLEQRLINIPAIIFYYLSTFFFPFKLAIMQYWIVEKINFDDFHAPLFWDVLFIIGFMAIGILIDRKIRTQFIFFLVWLSMGLLFHLQIFPLSMTVADRWFYFPMVGLLGIFGLFLQFLLSRYKYIHSALLAIGIIIVVLLSIRTMVRNSNWIDNRTLFNHDSKINENFIIESNLAAIYRHERNIPSAIRHYERSVALRPYEVNLYSLGLLYESINEKQKAREYFFRILEIEKSESKLYSQKLSASAWLLLQHDSVSNAMDFINKAIVRDPKNGYLWAMLAICEYRLGNKEMAIMHAEKAKYFSNDERISKIYQLIVENKAIPEDLKIIPE